MMSDPPANIWMVSAVGPLLVGLAIGLWFLALIWARWWERVLGVMRIAAIVTLVVVLGDPSFRGAPVMVMVIPLTVGGFALGAIAFGWTLNRNRVWYTLAVAGLLGGVCGLLKTDGLWGNFKFGLSWRWEETAE